MRRLEESLSTLRCPSCGHANRAAAKFCEECGTRRGSAAASAEPPRAPRDYTPRHLAEKILGSRAALEGERKQVTVLFADVKGSMDLAEQLDPEEWHRILGRFFQLLAEGVHRFEGTVNQYTGDGIMALFGAPIAHEDHARRACYAALHLAEALRRYGEELKRMLGLGFSVRMGLNSGEVVVGRIGDDLRMDYTAQGPPVGLAARMEQLAGPERVYLTEHTAALVSGFFQLRDLGPFPVKGVREPVRVYELEGLGPIRTRLEASRARGFSRFVGRDEEMKALEAALAPALEGAGQVVGVAGDAGVGKSRLCWELAERCRARGIRFAEGHAPPHGKMIPLLSWIDLYRSYFGITEQDDDETARDKIAGRTLRLDESLAESLPILFDFLGVPDPARASPPMDPEARQRQLVELAQRLARAQSRREPAVQLFEDLHWMDGASEAFLAAMVDVLPQTRTLLVVTFRPEYRAPWMESACYQQLSLLPLGPAAIAQLLDSLLGRDPSLAGGGAPSSAPGAGRGRARLPGEPVSGRRVCVQASADAGGCLPLPARRAARANPRPGCPRDQRDLHRQARRASSAPRASLRSRRREPGGREVEPARRPLGRIHPPRRGLRPLAESGEAPRGPARVGRDGAARSRGAGRRALLRLGSRPLRRRGREPLHRGASTRHARGRSERPRDPHGPLRGNQGGAPGDRRIRPPELGSRAHRRPDGRRGAARRDVGAPGAIAPPLGTPAGGAGAVRPGALRHAG